jgi:hypothetical protein
MADRALHRTAPAGEPGVEVYRTRRFTRLAIFGMLTVMALLVPLFLWTAIENGSPGVRGVVGGWTLAVGALWYFTLERTATRVEIDPDGECRFRSPTSLVARCAAADVSEIRARRAGNSPYVRVRVPGRSIWVLDIERIERFAARVARANPDLRRRHLARLSTVRGRRAPDPED